MVIAFLRTIILYLFIIVGIRLMGKRQVGENRASSQIACEIATVTKDSRNGPAVDGRRSPAWSRHDARWARDVF